MITYTPIGIITTINYIYPYRYKRRENHPGRAGESRGYLPCAILKFDGIDNINDIEKYKGCSLWIPREEGQELGEDEYYIADLLGMNVVLEDGTEFGTLKDVMETGANDVYIINSKEHGEVLLPAIKECILNVDLESNTMTIHLMKGLI